MKKKIIALLLSAAMMLSLTAVPAAAAGQTFTDVPETHWAVSYIQSAADDGVMNGVGDGVFAPGKILSRAEFIVMLMRAFYPDEVAAREAELKGAGLETAWYTAHCVLAQEKGLLAEISCEKELRYAVGKVKNPTSDIFEYSTPLSEVSAENITRIDMAAIAGKIMLDKGVPALSVEETAAVLSAVPDAAQVPAEQSGMMAAAYHYKVITGVDSAGTFDPFGTVDRAQAAAIYCRLRDALPAQTAEPAPTPSEIPDYMVESTPVVTSGKAPYATTEDSIVGTFSPENITISLNTHIAPVDFWEKQSDELKALVSKDAYNAIVFTMLNQEWLIENGYTVKSRTDYPKNFNAPCYQKSGVTYDAYALGAMSLNGYGYSSGDGMFMPNTEDTRGTGFFIPTYRDPNEMYNGAFAPIFAKFTPDMSDKDKIAIMVEAMCERFEYGHSGATWTSEQITGICDDYANNFCVICLAAGIPCILETGSNRAGNHAWNLVYADNEWLSVDVTASDTGGFQAYYTESEYDRIHGLTHSTDFTPIKLIIEALYQDVYGS